MHRAIDRVIVEIINRNPNIKQSAYLRLKCKNFMVCCFEINDVEDCNAVARSIEKLSNLSMFYIQCRIFSASFKFALIFLDFRWN